MVDFNTLQIGDFIYRDIPGGKDVLMLSNIQNGIGVFISYRTQNRQINPNEWNYIPLSLDLLQTLFSQTPFAIINTYNGRVRLDLSITDDNIFLHEGEMPHDAERRTFHFIPSDEEHLSLAERPERPMYLHEFQTEMRILLGARDYHYIFNMSVIHNFFNPPLS